MNAGVCAGEASSREQVNELAALAKGQASGPIPTSRFLGNLNHSASASPTSASASVSRRVALFSFSLFSLRRAVQLAPENPRVERKGI